jgi:hypothetical protein
MSHYALDVYNQSCPGVRSVSATSCAGPPWGMVTDASGVAWKPIPFEGRGASRIDQAIEQGLCHGFSTIRDAQLLKDNGCMELDGSLGQVQLVANCLI